MRHYFLNNFFVVVHALCELCKLEKIVFPLCLAQTQSLLLCDEPKQIIMLYKSFNHYFFWDLNKGCWLDICVLRDANTIKIAFHMLGGIDLSNHSKPET